MEELNLTKDITVKVKILQGKYAGRTIPIQTSLSDLIGEGLPDMLFEANIFTSMGHPCDYYQLLSIEY
jgi:hypothetical protein